MRKNFIGFLLLLQPAWGSTQTRNEVGSAFLRNYTPKEYGAQAQNWAIVQDQRNVIYCGNNGGVLEYDGVAWRLLEMPNKAVVRSLDIDAQGRIYVGGYADFGYLAPDSSGQMHFVSLRERLSSEDRAFGDVWRTHATSQGVYFQTQTHLFRWANNKMQVWKPVSRFHRSAVVRDQLYIAQPEFGLMQMQGDSLRALPGGESFASEVRPVILPYDEKKLLIGTRAQGLFLYDGSTAIPFPTEVDDFLRKNDLYRGAVLPNGAPTGAAFVLGTLQDGMAIIDANGRFLHLVNKAAGLPDNNVIFVFPEPTASGLWLALGHGLARVEIPSPLSLFGEQTGLGSTVISIHRHLGVLYVGTSTGVFYLQAQPAAPAPQPANLRAAEFRPVAGISTQCWSFLSIGKTLLVATGDGVYQIVGAQATAIKKSIGGSFIASVLHRSAPDTNRIFVGLFDGLASLHLNAHRQPVEWIDEGRIPKIHEQIRTLVESADGKLWLGTQSTGILRVEFPARARGHTSLHNPTITRFGAEHGLPPGGVYVESIAHQEFFRTKAGIFRFDEQRQRFMADSTFTPGKQNVLDFGILTEDPQGNVWINLGSETTLALRQSEGTYRFEKAPFLRFADFNITVALPEANGVVWFGGADGLLRYDPHIQKNYAANFSTLIRRVTINGDSVAFGGAVEASRGNVATWAYTQNAVHFEFAATSLEEVTRNRYLTFLEGFDKTWSEWGAKTEKDYTNLPEGDYRFHVRAKNVYDHEGNEAVYAFKILPPWYRTWWAYGGYAALLGLFVFMADRVQRRRVTRKERLRAELREAQFRAEAENERRRNVELLSEIGKEITASLDIDTIFHKLYAHVNQLADATIFGVGIYHPEKNEIEYKLAIAQGKRYAPYTRDTRDKNQFPVWCIENRRPILINDVTAEYRRYIASYQDAGRLLEDGTRSEAPLSLIYLPLISQERVLGVITIQSFQKNAYTEYHFNLLQNLATYTTIALDNANAYRQLNATFDHLQAMQQQLVTQEKLASLGQLTAGIAHEIKNPLNFVNNFAALSLELTKELREMMAPQKDKLDAATSASVEEVLLLLDQNVAKINEHGKRADSIVKGMLLHTRGESGERRAADINAILEEYVMLAYHGMRGTDSTFNIKIEKTYDASIGRVEVYPQDLSRVFLNLVNNACYATHEKKKALGETYLPVLAVATKNLGDQIEIRIRDNGNGIPKDIREKVFTPFFTTKPAGQGTGLGLSISYDIIVQQHRGEIKVETEEGKFTEFVVRLPRN